jgi:hypothetical protein
MLIKAMAKATGVSEPRRKERSISATIATIAAGQRAASRILTVHPTN